MGGKKTFVHLFAFVPYIFFFTLLFIDLTKLINNNKKGGAGTLNFSQDTWCLKV